MDGKDATRLAQATPFLALGEAGACDSRIHDNGHVVYVVRLRECAGKSILPTEFIEETSDEVTRYSITLHSNGESKKLDFRAVGPREVLALQQGGWREIPNVNTWLPRDGAGLLVKGNRAYLLGGWLHGPLTNEVWVSDDLVHWNFLGFAPWSARHGAAWLVHHDRLYVIGGEMLPDVWSSADGITWRLENGSAPFGKRYTPNAASVGGRLYVYAGMRWMPNDTCVAGQLDCTVEGFNDVWRSDDDGRTWSQVLKHAPWEPRGLIHGSVVHDGEIFVIGGGLKTVAPGAIFAETSAEFTDVWSSPDGRAWRLRLESLPFQPRTHFSVLGTSFGCVVSDGSVGFQSNVSNDLFIAHDCLDFREVERPPLPARHASSLAEFNGTLVILGGPPAGNAGTAIWQYVP